MYSATDQAIPGAFRRDNAAVLTGDVAGFTRLVADDLGSTVEVLETLRAATTAVIEGSGGTLVDFAGDEFMALLPTVPAAFRAAQAIGERVEAANHGVPDHRRVAFRMGIAVGELITDDTRVYGEVVNLAARIRETAAPGGIALSGDAYIRLDEPAARFEPLGLRRFKNVPAPVRVFRLRNDPRAKGERPARRRVGLHPCIGFSGVKCRTEAPEAVRTAELLTIELRSALLRLPGLVLTTLSHPSGDGNDAEPGHLLEVSVDQLGDEIRVYSELVDVTRWLPIWGDRYQFHSAETAVHLDSVVEAVVGAVDVETYFGEHAVMWRSTLSSESVGLMYRGWQQLLTGTPEGITRALELAVRVSRDEPEAPDGPSVAAFVVTLGILTGLAENPEDDLVTAHDLAQEGLRRGDPTGLSQTVIAHVLMSRGEPLRAREVIDQAIDLRRTCDASYAVKASIQRYLGEWNEAVENVRHAIALTPTSLPWYWTVLASASYVGERHEDVVDAVEPLLDSGAASLEALLLLAASQSALGMARRSAATVSHISTRYPGVCAADALRDHPFVDAAVIERWRRHLADAGLT